MNLKFGHKLNLMIHVSWMLYTSFLFHETQAFLTVSPVSFIQQSHKLPVYLRREKAVQHTNIIHISQNNPNGNKLYSTADFNLDYTLAKLGTDDASITMATKRMVDSFWLQPTQMLNNNNEDVSNISDSVLATLMSIQKEEFQEKFGERMGKRLLNTCIIGAKDSDSNLLGMVCIEGKYIY